MSVPKDAVFVDHPAEGQECIVMPGAWVGYHYVPSMSTVIGQVIEIRRVYYHDKTSDTTDLRVEGVVCNGPDFDKLVCCKLIHLAPYFKPQFNL